MDAVESITRLYPCLLLVYRYISPHASRVLPNIFKVIGLYNKPRLSCKWVKHISCCFKRNHAQIRWNSWSTLGRQNLHFNLWSYNEIFVIKWHVHNVFANQAKEVDGVNEMEPRMVEDVTSRYLLVITRFQRRSHFITCIFRFSSFFFLLNSSEANCSNFTWEVPSTRIYLYCVLYNGHLNPSARRLDNNVKVLDPHPINWPRSGLVLPIRNKTWGCKFLDKVTTGIVYFWVCKSSER